MTATLETATLHDCRDAFVATLQALATENQDIVAVVNDSVGSSKLGGFRDAFPQLVAWLNRATALVAAADEIEADNPLAAAARRDGHSWRVYGSAPGAYGAGLQGLIDSGEWESRADLAAAYLNWSSWRYEGLGGADGSSSSGNW